MGLFTFFESFNNVELFRNICIVLIFIYFFLKLTIGLNIILALALAILVILYLVDKKQVSVENNAKNFEIKKNMIKPKMIYDNDDLVDFIFSVQDFYAYNPETYEEFIDNINSFMSLKDNIFGDDKFANYYYQIAESKNNNALNSFHSLIFSLPNNKLYTEKFNRAHKRLETLLNKYLNDMYDRCNYYQIKNGIDTFKRQIDLGPSPYNNYFDKIFTYQFY